MGLVTLTLNANGMRATFLVNYGGCTVLSHLIKYKYHVCAALFFIWFTVTGYTETCLLVGTTEANESH